MAARILQKGKRLVAFWPGLREISQRGRAFSSDTIATLLGPEDKRLPLPGNVGLGNQLTATHLLELARRSGNQTLVELIVEPYQRLSDFFSVLQDIHGDGIVNDCGSLNALECVVQECPRLMKKDVQELFPAANMIRSCTVVTLCQRTQNDMTAWSESVDKEREDLTFYFHLVACMLRDILRNHGYWADFIDPASGKPQFSKHTNATWLETDERYRYLGFRIEDLGCCKVIEHHLWGTHSFVGSLFTDAPVNSPIFQRFCRSAKASKQ